MELGSEAPRLQRDAIDWLTFFGRTGGLIAIVGGLAASFFLFGYFVIYWRNADMDFMIVYNALLLNDGKPQEFFDHPSYLTILSVEYWFRILHGLGLLDAYSLSSIPSASNVPAFDAAMTQAVRAGRVLAWLTATASILAFAALIRRVIRDWRIALLATFAFGFSGGVAVHMRILRSEMIAASLVTFALLILVIAGRKGSVWRPLALAGAAALAVLGLENKVQVIVLIAALPVLSLAFGSEGGASVLFWRKSKWAWPMTLLAAIAAALLLDEALPILAAGLDAANTEAAGLRPLFVVYGSYQCLLVGFIAVCMVAFALIWRVAASETLTAIFSVLAGAALGLLALKLQFNVGNAVAVINPVEKMMTFAGLPVADVRNWHSIFNTLFVDFQSVLQRYTFFLYTSARPAVFLIWLVLPGIIYAWISNKRQVAVQALLLVLVATGVDTLGVQRGLKSEYFILTDPLIILAGAVLLDALAEQPRNRWAVATGVALFFAHILVSQAEPVKHVMKRSGPEYICEWNQLYQSQLPMPWCSLPPPLAQLGQ
jgi:hypothetical protein